MTLYTPNVAESRWDSLAGYPSIPVATVPGDPGLGTVGNRPVLTTKPSAANTGPRQAPTRTLSGSAALAEVLSAPVEADGKRYLRRASISGLTLDQAQHANIVFQDCVIEGGTYVLNAFTNGASPGGALPEFQYVEFIGGSSATVYGGQVRLLRCNAHSGTDIIKAAQPNFEIYGSYLHDTWHNGIDSHCDIVQIRSGAANSLFHWNTMDAFNDPDSPGGAGGMVPNNSVLQTGTVTGDIGPVDWVHNWFNGGGYTIRGRKPEDAAYAADYLFRNNRFGRDSRFGPLQNNGYAGFDFDTSNVWDDTGLPVN